MSKFLIICSCILCKKQTTVQSLSSHIKKHKVEMPPCKYCGAYCNSKNSFFCSTRCSSLYNHSAGVYLNVKTGPKRGSVGNPKVSKVGFCAECGLLFRRKSENSNTCSKQCSGEYLSRRIREQIYTSGRNPSHNRGRGKESFLEKSFRNWLIENFPLIEFQQEKTFKRKDITKSYFVDFYFPKLNLIIELDGSQHNSEQAKLYDEERDKYISTVYSQKIIRISHKEYLNKTKLSEIYKIFNEHQTSLELVAF